MFKKKKSSRKTKSEDVQRGSLSRRMPIRPESASRVRVGIAGGRLGRFSFLRRPVDRGRSSPQKVLRPSGLSLLDRNAFRRRHPFGIVLLKKVKRKTVVST